MNKIFLLFSILLFTGYSFAQTDSSKIDSTLIFVDPEILPSFPGGDIALNSYIMSNLKFPTCFREENIGTVYISFVVEKEGNLTDVKILRGIGVGFDEEAIRLIKQMPNWIPGSLYGKPTRTRFVIPVNFSLY